ncbi:hypothetical protein B296_00058075 [Ensete ventricosum]|uniref:Uncharacterized protein n=1 Tax=Ensete ventricosum TaxID=4639 RepID=A0A426XEH8_ENSVE|nr:hypothetical protein B296_00058075 [Ensete ventricosum]
MHIQPRSIALSKLKGRARNHYLYHRCTLYNHLPPPLLSSGLQRRRRRTTTQDILLISASQLSRPMEMRKIACAVLVAAASASAALAVEAPAPGPASGSSTVVPAVGAVVGVSVISFFAFYLQ